MKEILVNNCCLLNETEKPSSWCESKCGLYREAEVAAGRDRPVRPYVGTGFGNLYGDGELSVATIRSYAQGILARGEQKSEQ